MILRTDQSAAPEVISISTPASHGSPAITPGQVASQGPLPRQYADVALCGGVRP